MVVVVGGGKVVVVGGGTGQVVLVGGGWGCWEELSVFLAVFFALQHCVWLAVGQPITWLWLVLKAQSAITS